MLRSIGLILNLFPEDHLFETIDDFNVLLTTQAVAAPGIARGYINRIARPTT